MMTWIREKFGTVIIGGIISLIGFVFVFYGVFTPKATRGLHEGAVAGTVNGEPISIGDFNRSLNRRLEFFKSIGGDKITEEQLKSLRVREMVFEDLVQRKILSQQAGERGLIAANEEVKDRIQEVPAFQKDGKFDFATYKEVLMANRQTPGGFEKMVRDDLSVQQMQQFLRSHIRVSENELKQEYSLNEEKRKLRTILLTPETAKKDIQVSQQEVTTFLSEPGRVNLAKQRFEAGKDSNYKGQSFDSVKETIVRGIIAEGKTSEIQEKLQEISDRVLVLAQNNAKASEGQLTALVKKYSTEAKTTGWVTAKKPVVPGFGEAKELFNDAFSTDGARTPKKYLLGNRILVAWVVDSQGANFKAFEKEKDALLRQLTMKKTQDFFQAWIGQMRKVSQVESNPAVIQN